MDKKPEKLVPEVRFKGFTDDWEQRKLGEISKRVRNNDGRMNLPLLTISARYGWMTQQSRFSASIAGREKKNYTLLKKHQLSYNHGNSKVANYGTVYELTDYDEALVPKVYHSFSLTSENSSKFIESYFHTKKLDAQLRKFIASTARMDGLLNISFDDFMKVKLFAPERCEQSKISRIINLIEKLITLQQRKLEQLKQLKKALLQQLFVGKNNKQPNLRFKNFDGEWEQCMLKEIKDVRDGTHNSPKYQKEGYPLVTSKNLITNGIDLSNVSFISKYDYQEINKRSKVETGDILFGMIGTIGNPVMVKKGGFAIKNVALIKNGGEVSNGFLLHLLKSAIFSQYIKKENAGGTQKFLGLSVIRSFKFKVPDKVEQGNIASIFDTLNRFITLQQDNLTQLTTLKKYLLQKLFI